MPRSRPKNRKTKYLSLRRHLAPPSSKPTAPPPSLPLPQSLPSPSESPPAPGKQANLFPIQQDPDVRDPQVASLLFSSTNGETGETLTEILGTSTSVSAGPASDSCSAGSPGSPPVGFDTGDKDGDGLARRALRGRQRVEYCCFSSSSEEEVASACVTAVAGGGGGGVDLWHRAPQASASLLLKLDYDEILNAWSDQGSLYIDGEPAQLVPGFHHTAVPVWVTVGSSGEIAAMAWTVPEQGGDKADKGEVETREMRVKRYKEKRHNRLFAKKIRYEVRKLNAEKRPRLKGRFIKAMKMCEELAFNSVRRKV